MKTENNKKSNKTANSANSANFASSDKKSKRGSLKSLQNTPKIPIAIHGSLPKILKEGVKVLHTDREKDVFLTGALSILSGCLPNVQSSYFGDIVYANTFSFIIAPAASGKGVLKYAKILGQKIHLNTLEKSREELRLYSQSKKNTASDKKTNDKKKKGKRLKGFGPINPDEVSEKQSHDIKIEKPPLKMLYIPGNISSSKMIKQLEDNNGIGIICETEADVLGETFGKEWGSFSEIIRKAYHNEDITQSRRIDDEYIEIHDPKLSVVLSGTPDQVLNIIKSPEDGLFSRFSFYSFASSIEWRDPSPKSNPINLIDYYKDLSNDVYDMHNYFLQKKINITLSQEQWIESNRIFKEYTFRISNFVTEDAISVVRRLGLLFHKFCMIFTALREFETKSQETILQCNDVDFKNSIQLVDIYLEHAILVYENLPGKESKLTFEKIEPKFHFFRQLPNKFKRKDAVEMGKNLDISERTVDNYLRKLVEISSLVKPKGGYYIKSD